MLRLLSIAKLESCFEVQSYQPSIDKTHKSLTKFQPWAPQHNPKQPDNHYLFQFLTGITLGRRGADQQGKQEEQTNSSLSVASIHQFLPRYQNILVDYLAVLTTIAPLIGLPLSARKLPTKAKTKDHWQMTRTQQWRFRSSTTSKSYFLPLVQVRF